MFYILQIVLRLIQSALYNRYEPSAFRITVFLGYSIHKTIETFTIIQVQFNELAASLTMQTYSERSAHIQLHEYFLLCK